MNTNINRNYREARILLVYDNISLGGLIKELGMPTAVAQPVFPSRDELARIANSYDIMVIGPSMSVEDADAIFAIEH